MTRSGHTYTPAETVNYENLVKVLFREAYPDHVPTDAELTANIEAVFPIPESWSKKKKKQAVGGWIHPRKPDADNIAKAILDSLNGIAYADDSQIYRMTVTKRYGETPGVIVSLRYEKDEPEDFDELLCMNELPF
jgi:Holliday junction resolvase RusA-like endonuclease